ncbi:MAG TPA: amidinotransferase [Candidatus Coprenecus stercoravium]|uniref:Amidinotransferase n=1 Tax=Candidatus Coprenecus stercoravium TaxID=2840735 RepID=A0A9D2K964_9BACT|nr:amidinotransferase [Candidatus Coprenecus stercoravium]
MQTTSKVFMVKPARFAFNPQTGDNNAFSRPGRESSAQENALREFTSYVALLRANKIDVVIAEDTPHPHTPDSIFPNNWFSTHEDGTLVLYPMSAVNRRNERKSEVLEVLRKNFEVRRVVDLTWWENENLFLEGTGSMVLDRDNKIVYACQSYRTSERVLADFCKQMGYTPVFFEAYDRNGVAVYHTNVLMGLGTAYCVICTESIRPEDRDRVLGSITGSGRKILDITFEQLESFAGNMLELSSPSGRPVMVMSATARKSLTTEQSRELSAHYKLLSPQLDYIETHGGGSARCMLAELF